MLASAGYRGFAPAETGFAAKVETERERRGM
jgi:hypothetical protein